MTNFNLRSVAIAVAALGSAACFSTAHAGEAAAGGTAVDSSIPRCSKTLGAISVDASHIQIRSGQEDPEAVGSILRTMVLKSSCFVVTTQSSQMLDRKTDYLHDQGADSRHRVTDKHGKNTKRAADYYMNVTVNSTGGDRGVVVPQGRSGCLIKAFGVCADNTFGTVGINNATAKVTIEIYDIDGGVLLAGSSGKGDAKNVNTAFKTIFGSAEDSPDGRAMIAAIGDAFKSLVPALDNYTMQKTNGSLRSE